MKKCDVDQPMSATDIRDNFKTKAEYVKSYEVASDDKLGVWCGISMKTIGSY